MIYENMEFHNVAELAQVPGFAGLQLQRFPAAVRNAEDTNELARMVMQGAAGCEVRFVTPSKRFRFSVTNLDSPGQVLVFRGDFLVHRFELKPGETLAPIVTDPNLRQYKRDEFFGKCRFAPEVWRIWFGRSAMIFNGVDTFGSPIRPPEAEEKPSKRWLAYGSSYTMGAKSEFEYNNYVNIACRLAGMDGYNLGMGGSCHMDPKVVDFIVQRDDWDLATFRLGGNMIGTYSPADYKARLENLLDKVLARHGDKFIVLIGLSKERACEQKEMAIWQEHTMAYSEVDQEVFCERKDQYPKLRYFNDLEETSEFPPFRNSDLLHPDDLGFFVMGWHLAGRFKAWGAV